MGFSPGINVRVPGLLEAACSASANCCVMDSPDQVAYNREVLSNPFQVMELREKRIVLYPVVGKQTTELVAEGLALRVEVGRPQHSCRKCLSHWPPI